MRIGSKDWTRYPTSGTEHLASRLIAVGDAKSQHKCESEGTKFVRVPNESYSYYRGEARYQAFGEAYIGFAKSIVAVFCWIVSKKIANPPGHNLLKTADFVFPARFLDFVVRPLIFDMREEYFQALSQSRIWKARWVRVRGTYCFFAAIGLDRVLAFVSFFIKAWKSVT
jgi:hypothetical protein